jgi:hypothetical protein
MTNLSRTFADALIDSDASHVAAGRIRYIAHSADLPLSRTFADALIDSDTSRVAVGRIRYIAQSADLPPLAVSHVNEVADAAIRALPTIRPYHHPADGYIPHLTVEPELSAADFAWLETLPADPNAVSYDDARHLASLAARADNVKTKTSERLLVQQRWLPVRDAYDKREAQHTLARNYGTIPDPVDALAELIRKETADEVTDRECVARAVELRNHIIDEINSRRERSREIALKTIADIEDQAAQRSATTAPTNTAAQQKRTPALTF